MIVMTGSSRSVIGSKGGLRFNEAASRRGCCGCAATRRRSEWTRECPTRGKVAREIRESFSAGFGVGSKRVELTRKR